MIEIEVYYDYEDKTTTIFSNGYKFPFEYINERDISDWFEPRAIGRIYWKGLIEEICDYTLSDKSDLIFRFYGDDETKCMFEKIIKEHGISLFIENDKQKLNSDIAKELFDKAEICKTVFGNSKMQFLAIKSTISQHPSFYFINEFVIR